MWFIISPFVSSTKPSSSLTCEPDMSPGSPAQRVNPMPIYANNPLVRAKGKGHFQLVRTSHSEMKNRKRNSSILHIGLLVHHKGPTFCLSLSTNFTYRYGHMVTFFLLLRIFYFIFKCWIDFNLFSWVSFQKGYHD